MPYVSFCCLNALVVYEATSLHLRIGASTLEVPEVQQLMAQRYPQLLQLVYPTNICSKFLDVTLREGIAPNAQGDLLDLSMKEIVVSFSICFLS